MNPPDPRREPPGSGVSTGGHDHKSLRSAPAVHTPVRPGDPPRPGRTGHHGHGLRPALHGHRRHLVLPRPDPRGTVRLGYHHAAISWCGATAYLCDGPDPWWEHWPVCLDCVPGIRWHRLLTVLADAPPAGWTVFEVIEHGGGAHTLLRTLADLVHAGYLTEHLDAGILRYRHTPAIADQWAGDLDE